MSREPFTNHYITGPGMKKALPASTICNRALAQLDLRRLEWGLLVPAGYEQGDPTIDSFSELLTHARAEGFQVFWATGKDQDGYSFITGRGFYHRFKPMVELLNIPPNRETATLTESLVLEFMDHLRAIASPPEDSPNRGRPRVAEHMLTSRIFQEWEEYASEYPALPGLPALPSELTYAMAIMTRKFGYRGIIPRRFKYGHTPDAYSICIPGWEPPRGVESVN